MQPDRDLIVIDDNLQRIRDLLLDLVLKPRRDLIKWARLTKQTANIKLGYPGQHLASLVTGVEGTRTGARGHDLRDRSEVKSCSRIDQLDKCNGCHAAVARIETACPACGSDDITRRNDSKWLIAVRSQDELDYLLDEVPRLVLILGDYPHYQHQDWDTLRFQVFEIWPGHARHRHFRTLMSHYFHNIYLPHIESAPNRTPAPKNLWPYSFQFYMCNPVLTLRCLVTNASINPTITIPNYTDPDTDRSTIDPLAMPVSTLNNAEQQRLRANLVGISYSRVQTTGVTEQHRSLLQLRDTDRPVAQTGLYRRGVR